MTIPQTECAWCGQEFEQSGKGRPRVHCSRSCRQRLYEWKKGLRPGRLEMVDDKPRYLGTGAGLRNLGTGAGLHSGGVSDAH